MKNIFYQKGSIKLVVLVIVLSVIILSGVVGGAWWYMKANNNNDLSPVIEKLKNQTPPSEDDLIFDNNTSDITANWQTYTNEKYKFSFKYPNNYYILDKAFEAGQTYEDTAISDIESDGVLFYEGCSGLYSMSVDKVMSIPGGSFDTLGEKTTYHDLDNPQTTPIEINNHKGYRITGKYNKESVYTKEGELADIAVLLIGDNYITYDICKSLRYKENKGTQKEFDQILSTFKFTE